jgi:hypothetical protein
LAMNWATVSEIISKEVGEARSSIKDHLKNTPDQPLPRPLTAQEAQQKALRDLLESQAAADLACTHFSQAGNGLEWNRRLPGQYCSG